MFTSLEIFRVAKTPVRGSIKWFAHVPATPIEFYPLFYQASLPLICSIGAFVQDDFLKDIPNPILRKEPLFGLDFHPSRKLVAYSSAAGSIQVYDND